jgi:ankyrin repeat protein
MGAIVTFPGVGTESEELGAIAYESPARTIEFMEILDFNPSIQTSLEIIYQTLDFMAPPKSNRSNEGSDIERIPHPMNALEKSRLRSKLVDVLFVGLIEPSESNDLKLSGIQLPDILNKEEPLTEFNHAGIGPIIRETFRRRISSNKRNGDKEWGNKIFTKLTEAFPNRQEHLWGALAKKEDAQCTPYYFELQNWSETMIKALPDYNINFDAQGGSGLPLHLAAQNGNLGIVMALLSSGADPNARTVSGRTPIFQASQNGHQDIVDELILAGADVNTKAEMEITALHLACSNGRERCAKSLIRAGADVDAISSTIHTPLAIAAYKAHAEAVEALLGGGADVNCVEGQGWTPLHLAVQNSYPKTTETVEALVAGGANVNALTDTHISALHIAARGGSVEIIELLLAAGADKEARTDEERTPLFQAVANGHLSAVEALVVAGANVRVEEESGLNLLHIAVGNEDIGMLRRLLGLWGDGIEEGRHNLPSAIPTTKSRPNDSDFDENGIQMGRTTGHVFKVKCRSDKKVCVPLIDK